MAGPLRDQSLNEFRRVDTTYAARRMIRWMINHGEMKMPEWRKSTFSMTGECVEVAVHGDDVLIRNSQYPMRGTLRLERRALAEWLLGVKNDEFT